MDMDGVLVLIPNGKNKDIGAVTDREHLSLGEGSAGRAWAVSSHILVDLLSSVCASVFALVHMLLSLLTC